MIRSMFTGLGRLAIGLATMAFLVGVSLFVVGSYLTTWPILRLSPRNQRLRVVMDLATAMMTTVQVFAGDRLTSIANTDDDVS